MSLHPDSDQAVPDETAAVARATSLAGLGMTPADYRAKWGLPKDYPMVDPAYAAKRSALAKTIGLGRRLADTTPEPEPEAVEETPAEAPKKRGRAKQAA